MEKKIKPTIIILNHLREKWAITLSYTIFVTLMTLTFLILTTNFLKNGFRIWADPSKPIEGKNSFGILDNTKILISSYQVFLSFTIVYLINWIFSKEIKTGQISFWLTTSISRKNIYLYKIIFVWIVILIINFPSTLIILTVGIISKDFAEHFFQLLLVQCSITIFLFALTAIYTFITLFFIERILLAYVINSIIIGGSMGLPMLLQLIGMNPGTSEMFSINVMFFFPYESIWSNGKRFMIFDFKNIIALIITLITFFGLNFWSKELFHKKDFNI